MRRYEEGGPRGAVEFDGVETGNGEVVTRNGELQHHETMFQEIGQSSNWV